MRCRLRLPRLGQVRCGIALRASALMGRCVAVSPFGLPRLGKVRCGVALRASVQEEGEDIDGLPVGFDFSAELLHAFGGVLMHFKGVSIGVGEPYLPGLVAALFGLGVRDLLLIQVALECF